SCAQVREEAVLALIGAGKPSSSSERNWTVQALRSAITDHDKRVSLWARVALMRLEHVSDEHMKAVAQQLRSPDPELRKQAMRALAVMAADAGAYVSDIAELLGDRDRSVALYAINTLKSFGRSAQPALPELEKLLQDKSETIRLQAKEAIEAINPAAKAAEVK